MEEKQHQKRKRKLALIWWIVLEVCFIIFLFYSNLLMGEFTHSGLGQRNGLGWALHDIFTFPNFCIALILALIGQLFFEFFRRRL